MSEYNKEVIALKDRLKRQFEFDRELVTYEGFYNSVKSIFGALSNSEFVELQDHNEFLIKNSLLHKALLDHRLSIIKDDEIVDDFFKNERVSYISCKISNFIQRNDKASINILLLHDSKRRRKNSIEILTINSNYTEIEKSNSSDICFETETKETGFVIIANISKDSNFEDMKHMILIYTLCNIFHYITNPYYQIKKLTLYENIDSSLYENYTDEGYFIINIILASDMYSSATNKSVREIGEIIFEYFDDYLEYSKNRKVQEENDAILKIQSNVMIYKKFKKSIKKLCNTKHKFIIEKMGLERLILGYNSYFNINQ